MSQVLLTAYSNRHDAVQLAHEAQAHLHSEGISSALHLLDLDSQPDIDSNTLVVSLGGDGTFLQSARLAHTFRARVLAVNLGRVGFLLNVPSTELVADAMKALDGGDVVERLALEDQGARNLTSKSSP
jgi:NAD kinase